MKTFLKITLSISAFLMLSACATVGDYYVLEEGSGEQSQTTLYFDEELKVTLHHFNGNVSRLYFSEQKNTKDLKVQLLNLEHSLVVHNTDHQPSSSRGAEIGTLDVTSGYIITEVYKLNTPPKLVTEKINIELLVNETKISLSKEFSLKRVTYNRLQALWNM